MTLQQLRYVDAVATCGSFSEASRRLFVTQPTMTESIHALEEELRFALFSRTSRGVTVTREGEEFLASARRILSDVSAIQAKYTGRGVRLPQFVYALAATGDFQRIWPLMMIFPDIITQFFRQCIFLQTLNRSLTHYLSSIPDNTPYYHGLSGAIWCAQLMVFMHYRNFCVMICSRA